ncbi:hypothetical protein RN001_013147 [Aquatica leii]|uniref:Cytochrome b5 heme-binding domain-containing protein n=1 Tax=Aquatica leii TaxID=1421715 RepID=A0AAN7PRC2_9COLE|nr:hypothetical protein RN001_013147 [Aquatica leii]
MVAKHIDFLSTLGIKKQNNKNTFFKSTYQWLEDKKIFDGAEGLWRIHDNLYDLTNFIDRHPGGKFWLEISKGLDITEGFESYHISNNPEKILPQFFVRKALTPRNSPFTFKEDGFYKTLKRNVRKIWSDIPRDGIEKSKRIADMFFIISVALVLLATVYSNYFIGFLAGIMFAFMSTATHNYYHQKESFRSLYGYFGMSPSRDWIIIHVFSHHFHTNSVIDFQAYLLEPLMYFYPQKKSIASRYLSYIYGPLLIWPILLVYAYLNKIYNWIIMGHTNQIFKPDILAMVIPTLLYLITNKPLWSVLIMWIFVILVSGFWFNLVSAVTTHFHPNIFMDGDKSRSELEMDWGINQLDTVGDRVEINGNHFLSMIMFGDHALHHLFPSLDHGLLKHLYPVVEETLQQFNLRLRVTNSFDMIKGYFLRLSVEDGNPNPPSLIDRKNT